MQWLWLERPHKEGVSKQEEVNKLSMESSTGQCQHSGDDDDSLTVFYMKQSTTHPICIELELDRKPCEPEVDTGAAVFILSEKHHPCWSSTAMHQCVTPDVHFRENPNQGEL